MTVIVKGDGDSRVNKTDQNPAINEVYILVGKLAINQDIRSLQW